MNYRSPECLVLVVTLLSVLMTAVGWLFMGFIDNWSEDDATRSRKNSGGWIHNPEGGRFEQSHPCED
jgi:hypothetical protein